MTRLSMRPRGRLAGPGGRNREAGSMDSEEKLVRHQSGRTLLRHAAPQTGAAVADPRRRS